ncbi:MAG TPA: hypothetical protein VLU46_06410 [Thermoanaerobaculia bacterium]|nr:hypothetical protein [Thermoanaerobaculia bacterium]
MKNAAIAFLTIAALSCATAPQPVSRTAPPIWAGLTPGPYVVGFGSSIVATPPHPLQVNVWYPAGNGGAPLRYSDYVLLSLTEKSPAPLTEEQRQSGLDEFTKYLTMGGVSGEHVKALANAEMYARRDAPAIAGKKFPLIYVAQGNGQTASAQAILSEYLSSHGYVVVTTPSITRLTGPMTSDDDVAPKSVEQMKDIERAVESVQQLPYVDTAVPIAVVGHSFGARGALIYAMHHPTSAIVSLEGGIGMATGTRSMLDNTMVDLRVQLPPVLHFYELNDPRVIPDFRLLRALHTPDLELVEVKSMRHEHFTSDGFGAAMLPDIAALSKAAPGLKDDLHTVAEQTLAFIAKQAKRG